MLFTILALEVDWEGVDIRPQNMPRDIPGVNQRKLTPQAPFTS